MEKVLDHKDIVVKERNFRIRKFDARTGAYTLMKLMGLLAPAFASLKTAKDMESLDLTALIESVSKLTEEDFLYIQSRCLKNCFEMLPSGPTPVMNDNDTFGVIGLEYDVSAVFNLMAQVIGFNLAGFFGESLSNFNLGGN